MKKNVWLVICFFCTLNFGAINAAISSPVLRLNDINWPPYFFPNKQKDLPGIGKEILNQCLGQMDYVLDYLTLPIKRTHAYMKSGDLDLVVYSYKLEREEDVYYGKEPLFISEYGFVTKVDSGIELTSFDDLKPLVIGHLAGLSHTPELAEIIDEKRKRGEIKEGFDIKAMFNQMLASPKQFDIMPNSKSTFYWTAKEMGISEKIKVLNFTIAQKPYFVTISKNSKHIKNPQHVLAEIDKCIKEIKESGRYIQILNNYGQ